MLLTFLACLLFAIICEKIDLTKILPQPRAEGARSEIIFGWSITAVILTILNYVSDDFLLYEERTFLTWIIATPVLLVAAQCFFADYIGHQKLNKCLRSTVVIGLNGISIKIADTCSARPEHRISIDGFFDDRNGERVFHRQGHQVLGFIDDVVPYIRKNNTQILFISNQLASRPKIQALTYELQDTTTSIYFIHDSENVFVIEPRLEIFGGLPVIALCETPILGFNKTIKRIFDIALSLLAIILFAPLMACTAIAVLATSRGPIIFSQERYGLNGEKIRVYKFRSMYVSKESDKHSVIQAVRNDARFTPIGAFLRRSSIDELPQLFNVLQGTMSVVGPRPHAVAHNEQYRKLIRGYMLRHKIQPGITGWAQVNGLRGETTTTDRMELRVQYDLDYLRNWSLWLDLWIIARTARVILQSQNAY